MNDHTTDNERRSNPQRRRREDRPEIQIKLKGAKIVITGAPEAIAVATISEQGAGVNIKITLSLQTVIS
ncbi:MAG: hypothetical protein PHG36_12300 [Dehalococcoidia bacterium]|nr:hypothetical protein [Dehalococcoidia bacterium]